MTSSSMPTVQTGRPWSALQAAQSGSAAVKASGRPQSGRGVLGARPHETLEERTVLGALDEALRVPLDSEHEAGRGGLDRLHDAVRGPADHTQTGGDGRGRLMMERVDL